MRIIPFRQGKTKGLISLLGSTADLHLCCSRVEKAGFLTILLAYFQLTFI